VHHTIPRPILLRLSVSEVSSFRIISLLVNRSEASGPNWCWNAASYFARSRQFMATQEKVCPGDIHTGSWYSFGNENMQLPSWETHHYDYPRPCTNNVVQAWIQLSASHSTNAVEFEIGIGLEGWALNDNHTTDIGLNQVFDFWREAKEEWPGKSYLNHITSRGTFCPNKRLSKRLPCHTWSHTAVVRYVASGLDVKRRRNRRDILETKSESKMSYTGVKHVPEGRSFCIQTRSAMDANERRSPRRCEKQAWVEPWVI